MSWGYGDWPAYVSVAEKKRRAEKKLNALRKKGVNVNPVEINGRLIARSFWGRAWCDHLESFSDYENRLPRGRSYVRNGSVCHLEISRGEVKAKVAGTRLYNTDVKIKTLPETKWKKLKQCCSGRIATLLELLQGKLSDEVMQVVCNRQDGLFPLTKELSFQCSCPDWAMMCKHVAAVLYGIGSRLDEQPELLFLLRGVDHEELIQADAESAVSQATAKGKSKRLSAAHLSDIFGVEVDIDGRASSQNTEARGRRDGTKTKPRKKSEKEKSTKRTRTISRKTKDRSAPESKRNKKAASQKMKKSDKREGKTKSRKKKQGA